MQRFMLKSKIHRATVTDADLRNSGTICLNGAAARKVAKGDLIIIATYVIAENEKEAKNWKPKNVFVDSKNKIQKSH